MQTGSISVQTENIFPIIKQFLYSDQEIFLRELVSNAVDATSKLKTLSLRGEVEGDLGNLNIEVINDKENNKLIIRDRGIGMSEEEVKKYLNQVAFSSAEEFIEKYKDDASVIGHFGLGFYSAFMVAEKVEVETKSHKNTPAVRWSCTGSPEYSIEGIQKAERGTDIILHISDDAKEYLEDHRLTELLEKYCKFLPIPIQFGTKTETIEKGEGDDKKEEEVTLPNVINNPSPAWKKSPSELTEEDYTKFYQELYPFSPAPHFWIHLNIDYPFNLTGILYFPKIDNSIELQKNKIQLYSNQVYVTDNVNEIVPEFLTLLHGVIDSPDIPLNVSRSYLQSDRRVKQITQHITKKVADKLKEIFKKDRENFESKWTDVGTFVKYGMITDEKFYDKATKFFLFKNDESKHFTLEEYKEKIKENQTDKDGKLVAIYSNEPEEHNSFIQGAKKHGFDVILLDKVIDNHFVQQLETKDGSIKFTRVDSEIPSKLVDKGESNDSVLDEEAQKTIEDIFKTQLGEKSMSSVETQALSPDDDPVMITKPEFMRRFKEMNALQGGGAGMGMFPDSYNVVVNTNHPLIAQKLLRSESADEKNQLAKHLYDLALLNQNMLKGEAMTNFIKKSLDFLKD